ncbi:sugar 3,4-ketoisomerase [Prevotella sp. E13-27]|uniref:sugar 3,4-ketoisomerase n=1 Tax=Prevotella sp. E13-27 TaxID=2938122 RepID=UPI00200A6861|nr:FdtA/QdtA family cupin domain-containing protein [Prevotella sp. E13-27]MCK8623659.1 FdtA/QdtA family cupin domain-containing protein [Prevotella sp. E13-27]
MASYSVFDCTIVELDKHHSDRKGNLTVVQNGTTFPFDVKRVYYLYDVPGGESRGSHAHRDLEQLIVAASGSFTVTLDDGKCKRTFFLNRPYQGLYVKPGLWRDLEDFSSGAVCMVLASEVYQADDYIRDYDDFLEFRKR